VFRVAVLFFILSCCSYAYAFAQAPKPITLNGGTGHISVRGKVGGEEHDAYMLKLEAGRSVRIALSSTGGKASLKFCDSDDFSGSAPVAFGKRSPDGKSWTGRIPAQHMYYIYIVAHPEARYILSLWVK
jgi:hypothetical protein